MVSIYLILVTIFALLIYRKVIIILITFLLNFNYICHIINYQFETDLYKYILLSLCITILVFRMNSIMPLFVMYMFVFLLYNINIVKNMVLNI
jgi:hypothetical protein